MYKLYFLLPKPLYGLNTYLLVVKMERRWNPYDDFGKKSREDGAGIIYSPYHGHWNDEPNVEIAYDKIDKYIPEHHPPHIHDEMTETYMAINGSAILVINEKEEYEMKPNDILKVKPGEIHRIVEIVDADKNGPFEFFLVKAPSIEGDKRIVEPTYKKR